MLSKTEETKYDLIYRYLGIIYFFLAAIFVLARMFDMEARSIFAQLILEGELSFFILLAGFIVFLTYIIQIIIKRLIIRALVSAVSAILIISFYVWLKIVLLSDLGTFTEDRIIYHSATIPSKKLIAQYYETGFFSNPNWRVILVNDINASFRRSKEIDLDLDKQNSDSQYALGDRTLHYNLLPKKIEYNQESYQLESTTLFTGEIIQEKQD
jgi:hypothetical protein